MNREAHESCQERNERIKALMQQGMSYADIAVSINVSPKRLDKIVTNHKLREHYVFNKDAADLVVVNKLLESMTWKNRRALVESSTLSAQRFGYLVKKYALPLPPSLTSMVLTHYASGATKEEVASKCDTTLARVSSILWKAGEVREEDKRKTINLVYRDSLNKKEKWFFKSLMKRPSVTEEMAKEILETVDLPARCPVFGYTLHYGGSPDDRGTLASIDQIKPGEGYVVGNVQLISYKANRIKGNATPEELRKLADFMSDRYKR